MNKDNSHLKNFISELERAGLRGDDLARVLKAAQTFAEEYSEEAVTTVKNHFKEEQEQAQQKSTANQKGSSKSILELARSKRKI